MLCKSHNILSYLRLFSGIFSERIRKHPSVSADQSQNALHLLACCTVEQQLGQVSKIWRKFSGYWSINSWSSLHVVSKICWRFGVLMNPNKNECKELKEGTSKSSAGFWEYHGLARDGINLLLNNGFEESQKLFRSHRFVFSWILESMGFVFGDPLMFQFLARNFRKYLFHVSWFYFTLLCRYFPFIFHDNFKYLILFS